MAKEVFDIPQWHPLPPADELGLRRERTQIHGQHRAVKAALNPELSSPRSHDRQPREPGEVIPITLKENILTLDAFRQKLKK